MLTKEKIIAAIQAMPEEKPKDLDITLYGISQNYEVSKIIKMKKEVFLNLWSGFRLKEDKWKYVIYTGFDHSNHGPVHKYDFYSFNFLDNDLKPVHPNEGLFKFINNKLIESHRGSWSNIILELKFQINEFNKYNYTLETASGVDKTIRKIALTLEWLSSCSEKITDEDRNIIKSRLLDFENYKKI